MACDMGMDRFFAERCDVDPIRLAEPEARHALKSRRLSVGDVVVVFDGRGTEAHGRIAATSRTGVTVVSERVVHRPRPTPMVTVFVAPPKGPRQDTLIEKCAELGVAAVCPLLCARSVADVSEHRLARWRRSAIEAAKQSNQAWIPEFTRPIELGAARDRMVVFDRVWVALSEINRGGKRPMGVGDMLPDLHGVDSVAVLIGPEGGWTDEEAASLLSMGARPVQLGPNTLRIETAAIVVAGLIHALQESGT